MIGQRMRRVTAVAVLTMSLAVLESTAAAQDARQRQAAAEAYDRGTAAYLEGAYAEAGQWFETAHRMAPAAPALMQAIRAHEHNDNHARAATLALELAHSYRDDKAASDFAAGVLSKNAGSLLRIDVTCDEDCKLDLDGKLQEFLSFFVVPGSPHKLTATFETGSRTASLEGEAGETRSIAFEAPPPAPAAAFSTEHGSESGAKAKSSRPPLSPLYTWIGVGVTGALGIATIISGVDANSGVPGYKDAAAAAQSECEMTPPGMACAELQAKAKSLLEEGQSKELRTNVLIGVTAFAAVGTGVIALFLTDWSGTSSEHAATSFGLSPVPGGVMSVVKGKF
jgi:hypothetical protein